MRLRGAAPLVLATIFLLVGCGGDEAGTDDTAEGPVANACPAEGCLVTISNVVPSGDELEVTWEANFLPDVSRNHIHVYWDIYTAEQVSDDAAAQGVEQGDWVPTDAYPMYTTDGPASVAERGSSTTLCVTAADRGHVVLDASVFDCVDVGEHLG